jgi:serine phosphatase RsbU (regulator of sigma subunit)/tetratricopeptide (TPR) repeat protein
MKKALVYFSLFFIGISSAFGYNKDSLEDILSAKPSVVKQINQCLNWAYDLEYTIESADYWFGRAQKYAEEGNLKSELVYVHSYWANIKIQYSLVEESAEQIIEAKKYISDTIGYNFMLVHKGAEAAHEAYLGHFTEAGIIREKALETAIANNDSIRIAIISHNLAIVYYQTGQYRKADSLLQIAYEINKIIGQKENEMNNISMLANVNNALGRMEEALQYNQISLKYYDSINDPNVISMLKINIGSCYLGLKNYKESENYINEGVELALANGYLHWAEIGYNFLHVLYKAKGDYKTALEYRNLEVEIADSLLNEKSINKLAKLQKALDDNKIELLVQSNLVKKKKNVESDIIIKNTNIQLYIAMGAGVLFLILGFIVFRGYRNKKKANVQILLQKSKIDEQRAHLEQKNTEILDSINYAKRIQTAILPSEERVLGAFPNSFISYLPKDIVAGDFYWMHELEDSTIIAAADCTGHGVPGAMVSVVCNNALNRSVREFGITDTGKILDKTRELVIAEFVKAASGDEIKDGMDIAICNISKDKIQFSGANNPLWLVREGELMETKGDKQPIGRYDHAKPFTTINMDIKSGDQIYLMSDGYIDQFGGEKGKKFKANNLKQLILNNANSSMLMQKSIYESQFHEWKGDLEQLDDVCVIGISI